MLNRFELAKVTHNLNRTIINENNIVPSWLVCLIMRTITPLTISNTAKNQWGYSFRCQS
jgi:hypothetical protein